MIVFTTLEPTTDRRCVSARVLVMVTRKGSLPGVRRVLEGVAIIVLGQDL
jgi:hypothetical protein